VFGPVIRKAIAQLKINRVNRSPIRDNQNQADEYKEGKSQPFWRVCLMGMTPVQNNIPELAAHFQDKLDHSTATLTVVLVPTERNRLSLQAMKKSSIER